MQRSSSPCLINDTISFLLLSGWRKSGFFSNNSSSLSAYLESLKKYASSLAAWTGRPQSGQQPFTSWLGPEGFAWSAVKAFVFTFVDIAFFVELHEDLLHPLHVARFCSSNEIVIGDLHGLPRVLIPSTISSTYSEGNPPGLGQRLYLLSVLICTRQEAHIVAAEPLEPGHGVSHHGTVVCPICRFELG